MRYSIDVERSVDSLAYCLQKINNEIKNIDDWRVSINAGGIDYGIYLNFDTKRKELEICNQPAYGFKCNSFDLDIIIEQINENSEE